MGKRLTLEEWISRASIIHKCKFCNIEEETSKYKQEFLIKAKQIHGDRYKYDLVNYINNWTPISILCEKHGEFKQTPINHTGGKSGCKQCGIESSRDIQLLSTEDFIRRSSITHNNFYNYNKSISTGYNNLITITCPIHGDFEQLAGEHSRGARCQVCAKISGTALLTKTQGQFIDEANKVHDFKYDYSKTVYEKANKPCIVICNTHGEFLVRPNDHLHNRQGRFRCNNYKGEVVIDRWLNKNKIIFSSQETFKDTEFPCRNPETGAYLKFDFYIPGHSLICEFMGKQHYEPHSFSSDQSNTTKLRNLQGIQYRDRIKREYAKSMGIEVLDIKYDQIKNIDSILSKKLGILNAKD